MKRKKFLLEYLNRNYLRSGWATIHNLIYWLLVAMNKGVSVEAVDLKYKLSKYLLFWDCILAQCL